MPSPLTISKDAELKRLLDHIAHDIINAGAYLRLHSALAERFESHKHEVNQTPAFWTFTANAVRDAGLLCLARILDQRHGALSLYTLLLTIRDHPEFFADEAVRKRVNPIYAESMRSGCHTVDNQLLTEHLKLVSAEDPLTKKIVLWRNTLGAHRASRVILTGQFPEAGLASRDDCVTLLDRAFSIFNHYTSLFHATTTSTKIIGEENHDFVFELLRIGLKTYEHQFARDLENVPSA